MKKVILVLWFSLLILPNSFCGDIFTPRESVILGITQGATEFLPISSTAHLILVDKFMGSRSTAAAEESELQSRAKNSYFSIIQCGSILAVLILYRHRFWKMLLWILGKRPGGGILPMNLVVSFLPASIIGFCADGWVQRTLYGKNTIAAALIAGGVLMVFAERAYEKKSVRGDPGGFLPLESLTVKKSWAIGCWQCLSFIPGMSRSMATIVGGYACGFGRREAAEYSFLLGFVTLGGATAYKIAKDFHVLSLYFSAQTFGVGIFVAFLASIIAIKCFTALIVHRGMLPFALYRLVLAAVILHGTGS